MNWDGLNMKKVIKIACVVLCSILILWCGVVITDYIRIGNLKEPVFAAKKNENGSYNGLGYSVTVKRTENDDLIEYTEMKMFGKVVSAAIACYD